MATGMLVAKKKSAKSTSESRQYTSLVRLADDVVADARILASIEGSSMAEIISDTMRPILRKRLEDAYRKRLEEGR